MKLKKDVKYCLFGINYKLYFVNLFLVLYCIYVFCFYVCINLKMNYDLN